MSASVASTRARGVNTAFRRVVGQFRFQDNAVRLKSTAVRETITACLVEQARNSQRVISCLWRGGLSRTQSANGLTGHHSQSLNLIRGTLLLLL